ncbi:alpha-aspartyl dipeptidase-like [Pecten maximus]|uniref:alpha-aspartyl dipeptidase-like n=1 Tax=Pecten maximus TaxID=6579 RepID=UPI0014590711|nr:alpha-aspartyl dipeptidase-like [Pecten maximus]
MGRRLLLISNSTLHGGGYLEHCTDQIKTFLREVKRVLFVPYALHDRDEYANIARKAFKAMGYELDSIHTQPIPIEAVKKAEAVFIGGGNTFRLLTTLYKEGLVDEIKHRVEQDGVPYIGSSAGSNVATFSINTTNDMPIVYPPSFLAINLVPFNINAHYTEPAPGSTHMGETREARIKQYHEYPDAPPVLGMREGCMLLVEGDKATLMGQNGAKLFVRGVDPKEIDMGADLSFLL